MTHTSSIRSLVLLTPILLCSGCGLGLLQTAKTTPRGETRFSFAAGYLHNEMVVERDQTGLGNFPQQFGVRYGATDQLDLGARQFLLAGALADAKINFIHHESPLAISLQGGLGAAASFDHEAPNAWDMDRDGWLLHLPISLLASYQVLGWLSPYFGLGYGFCWIFDREIYKEPDVQYAEREGYGDGLLMINLGVELEITRRFAVLMEYDLWAAVVDDPGDFYSFSDSHMLFAGVRF